MIFLYSFSYFEGFISSQDYIRLRTTTKDTKRPVKIAKKTQTYLDKVRQKYIIETPTTTTTRQPSTTLKVAKDNQDNAGTHDHPTAHRRPASDEDSSIQEEPSRETERSNIHGVQLVTPVYGEFTPSASDTRQNRIDSRYLA